MPEVSIDYVAVLIAAIVNMIIGAVWYAPKVFGKAWMKFSGIQPEQTKKAMGKIYGLTVVASLVMSYVLAHMVDYVEAKTISGGLQAGFWLWFGFVATTFLTEHLFSGKSLKLYAMNVGYRLLSLLVMGALLAVWP